MRVREDFYIYNESNGVVLVCRNLGGRKPFDQESSAWKKAIRTGEVVALGLAQDDPFVVRVVLNEALTELEQAEWVDEHQFKLHLPQDGLAISGGSEYLEDPSSDNSNECVQLIDIPAGTYLAKWYTFVSSPNYQTRKDPWTLPELTDGRHYVDFLIQLTPFVEQTELAIAESDGWIPHRPPTRPLSVAPVGIIAKNPRGWSPTVEEPKPTLVRVRPQMRVIATPPGDAPEWVRAAWIGLVMPLGVPILPEAASARDKKREVIRFAVFARDAFAILAAQKPEAAKWWLDKYPAAASSKTLILDFAAEACELVNR